MHVIPRFHLAFGFALLIAALSSARQSVADDFRVAGYLPDYRAADFDVSSLKFLTDLIVFSAEPTDEGEIDWRRLERVPWDRLRAAKTRSRVRLILCVGGWERSSRFAAVAGSAEKRRSFARAAVKACLERRLDGVDLDWEHPRDEREQANYGLLLADLREAFAPHGLTLSVTIAAWQKLPASASAAVDAVQIMAYDHEGRHSTLEAAESDVRAVRALGVPADKVVLGLPFYGRRIARRDEASTWAEIVAKHRPAPEVDEVDGIYFNGPATIRRKVELARRLKLGGVMIWELGQDAPAESSLLREISRAVADTREKDGTR